MAEEKERTESRNDAEPASVFHQARAGLAEHRGGRHGGIRISVS